MDFLNYYNNTKTGFKHNKKGDVEFLTIPSFDNAGGIVHGFTTRNTGVSQGGFESLNFSSNREKNQENILKNYKIISETLGVSFSDMVLDNYGHTPNVLVVTEQMRGKGVYQNMTLPTCDGLAVMTPQLYTDCNLACGLCGDFPL